MRKMAQDACTSAISDREAEVSLCCGAVEGLPFLLWRHLEHFMLYTSAATTVGPNTPFQSAYSRLNTTPAEVGAVGFTAKAGFSQVDLDRLKTEAALTLNEAFFEKLSEYCEGEVPLPEVCVEENPASGRPTHPVMEGAKATYGYINNPSAIDVFWSNKTAFFH